MAKKAEQIFNIPKIQKIGVYAIHNKENDKYYIGSSVNVYNRMLTHARSILHHGGINLGMIKDFYSIDYDKIEFIVLKTFEDDTITDSLLRSEEWEMIKKYGSFEDGYNKAWTHGNGFFEENELLKCNPMKVNKKNYDRVSLVLPKGTKERIKELTGKSCNAYLTQLALADLERIEKENNG